MSEQGAGASRDEIKTLVLQQLLKIAPDIAAEDVEENVDFRDQFDFDSMDQLHFVIALHDRTGIDIPEKDYSKLSNLNACIVYLQTKLRR